MNPSAEAAGRVAGAVALVTGAASGIGRASARLLAAEGAEVAVLDRDAPGAETVAAEIIAAGGAALAHPMDVTVEADWDAAIDRVERELGPLTIAVHSAGISFAKSVTETSIDEWRRVIAVNLDGAFLATRAAMSAMRRSGDGSIVHVASASGVRPSPGASAYCASKAGVIQLTRTAALECTDAGDRIRVNCVVPGGVKTPMWRTMEDWPAIEASDAWTAPDDAPPGRRFAAPDEIARAILFLASSESSFVTGSSLVVDGGYTAS